MMDTSVSAILGDALGGWSLGMEFLGNSPSEVAEGHDYHPEPLALSVNAGSSSLKISLYAVHSHEFVLGVDPVALLLTSSISNISAPPARFSFKVANADGIVSKQATDVKDEPVDSITDHASAFAHFLDYLKQEANIDRERIQRICHRVVHGGNYSDPVIISDASFHHIERLSDLAPLHNGAALSVIKACIANIPSAQSIAYFDTAFHRPMPAHISSYAINQTIAKKRGLKKYGFHGLVLPSELNLIVLHLGSGASACAIKEGKSLDTSMGLTPLNGLPGATRAGAIDPSLIFHYTNKAGKITHDRKSAVQLHVTEVRPPAYMLKADCIDAYLSTYRQNTSSTPNRGGRPSRAPRLRTGHRKADLSSDPDYENNPNRLAFDLLIDRIVDYVGGYYLKLNGESMRWFLRGHWERSKEVRQVIGGKMACLGFEAVDEEKNEGIDVSEGVVVDLGAGRPNGDVVGKKGKKLLVCRTDEQLEMARECALAKKFWE
ncbi:Acetokinase family-domain-containing protein [Salix suchowensis]|nr:Acetokinase family-domain-containing protein [Salix suchowensis]